MSQVYNSFNYPKVNSELARTMGLSLSEYEKACELLGRTPNYIELGCVSAMWSEHCSYKSSKIHLKKLPSKGKDVVFGPGENAGVVRVDKDICVCFKIESHNSPSYHDPFNGAATGVGGILRDVFTMGAKPVAGLNSLRFGELEGRGSKADSGKSATLLSKAIEGMAHYGENFGLPMVGGELAFGSRFHKNPLVNAFVIGVVKEGKIFTSIAKGVGNPIIYVGSKTGAEGILGAAMASEDMGSGSKVAVPKSQVGDPVKGRNVMGACLELMDSGNVVAIQDMGAAGLTSSTFEMASKGGLGVRLNLEMVPLQDNALTPYEIMLSETQERMLIVARRGSEDDIIDMVKGWDVDVAVIGEMTDDGYVRLFWNSAEVAAVEAGPLANNAPMYDRPYAISKELKELADRDLDKEITMSIEIQKTFLKMLGDPNIACKGWVADQFNKDNKLLKDITVGGDSSMIRLEGIKKGVLVSVDCNSRYCYIDPKLGAMHAVAEAARNVAVSGATPKALSNCLNFGNPEKEEGMYQLVQGIEGIAEASRAMNIPVVSGNVSLFNTTVINSGETVGIYPTPTIAMVGVIDDADKKIDSFFKEKESRILYLGDIPTTINGSRYAEYMFGAVGGKLPDVNTDWHNKLFSFMAEGADRGLMLSAHDVSDGGIAVSLLEMGLKNSIGMNVTLPATARVDAILFGETPAVIIEVSASLLNDVTALCNEKGLAWLELGETGADHITINIGEQKILSVPMGMASAMYMKSLEEKMIAALEWKSL